MRKLCHNIHNIVHKHIFHIRILMYSIPVQHIVFFPLHCEPLTYGLNQHCWHTS